jgi:hypothetical protein
VKEFGERERERGREGEGDMYLSDACIIVFVVVLRLGNKCGHRLFASCVSASFLDLSPSLFFLFVVLVLISVAVMCREFGFECDPASIASDRAHVVSLRFHSVYFSVA